jgi:hypothetical protein
MVTIQEVSEILLHQPKDPIGAEDVRQWLESNDIEVLGAAFRLLHNPEQYTRVSPPLTFNDYRNFHIKYFARCLREDPKGDWCESRYLAGHSLVRWFKGLWSDQDIPREALAELKALLGQLAKEPDEGLRNCILTAVLEHLFEDEDILAFFSEWKEDRGLRSIYDEAREEASKRQT